MDFSQVMLEMRIDDAQRGSIGAQQGLYQEYMRSKKSKTKINPLLIKYIEKDYFPMIRRQKRKPMSRGRGRPSAAHQEYFIFCDIRCLVDDGLSWEEIADRFNGTELGQTYKRPLSPVSLKRIYYKFLKGQREHDEINREMMSEFY